MLIGEHVTGEETVEVLRRLLNMEFDEVNLLEEGKTWDSIYMGYFPVIIDGYEIWIWKADHEIGHIELVSSPDDREGNQGVWAIEEDDDYPMSLLTHKEKKELVKLLKRVRYSSDNDDS